MKIYDNERDLPKRGGIAEPAVTAGRPCQASGLSRFLGNLSERMTSKWRMIVSTMARRFYFDFFRGSIYEHGSKKMHAQFYTPDHATESTRG